MSTVSPYKHFIVHAFGPDRVGIVSELSRVVLDNGGNIAESRMVRMGGDFTVVMRMSMRKELQVDLADKLREVADTDIILRETTPEAYKQTSEPEFITRFELSGADNPGLVTSVAEFFAARGIRIDKLSSETRGAPFGGTTLFVMKGMAVSDQPVDRDTLESDFEALQDDLGVDLVLSSVEDPLIAH